MNISDPAYQRSIQNGHTYGHDTDPRINDSPMEKAIRFVERYTKTPRAEWEHKIGHKYVQAANSLAKKCAGVPEQRTAYVGRGYGMPKPSRRAKANP